MTALTSRQFADLIRETVWSVEQRSKITPDDPNLLELKRTLLLRIAALEAEPQKSASSAGIARAA